MDELYLSILRRSHVGAWNSLPNDKNVTVTLINMLCSISNVANFSILVFVPLIMKVTAHV